MKDTTRATLTYLATKEGKKDYRDRLAAHRRGEDRTDGIWDRFPGYALEDIHRTFGGGGIDQDAVMDPFLSSTKVEDVYTHALPRIIATTTNVDKLAGLLAEVLDDDQRPDWN